MLIIRGKQRRFAGTSRNLKPKHLGIIKPLKNLFKKMGSEFFVVVLISEIA